MIKNINLFVLLLATPQILVNQIHSCSLKSWSVDGCIAIGIEMFINGKTPSTVGLEWLCHRQLYIHLSL